ncbi:glycerol kinase GlpK [Mucilaginibacter sp. L196]|uniref:FGGY family carbohydrate kinase n=1 Tax=Mucilaginibacter sp. L196 TaxID=1641870 RepID=UPI00131AEEAC|nr:glycerol kinase GlpK [Mucilaginibacter sp. L196]
MGKQYILAIDQGTSSTKTIVFDNKGNVIAKATESLKTFYNDGGFVEQDPEEIYINVLASVTNCLTEFKQVGGNITDIKTCGISNQRETFVVWDENGTPLYNAVVWQCKRSISICKELEDRGITAEINSKTGLIIDPYFSGTKLIWLYENEPLVKTAIDEGKAYFGTIDTWLLYKLTDGTQYLTDYTNASRTLFFNLHTLTWDKELLQKLNLSNINLPQLKPSSSNFGVSDIGGLFPHSIVIGSMIGDSHAAAFGEGCFDPGTAKATLGTGCSILMNIGNKPKVSGNGMITTICWSMEGRVDYALEGVIVSCGATIEWLKSELGLFKDSKQTEAMATSVADNNGVYLVPAFSGLGAPHWDMNRKAEIKGLTFNCNKNHVVRAALESIPYQVKDVIVAMEQDTGIPLQQLMVNGGITSNHFVLQFMADLLDRYLINRGIADVSALGAAYLAGLQAGIFKDLDHLKQLTGNPFAFSPVGQKDKVLAWYEGWKIALAL